MNRLAALCPLGTSFTDSTRKPRLTLARIGFSAVSNASSVMPNSVTRTGRMRDLLHTNSASGVSIGTISSVPICASRSFARSWPLLG